MSTRLQLVIGLIALSAWLLSNARPASAALYWFNGVRAKTISVCFVGNALTARPARVQQVLAYIKHFEYAANIRFNDIGTCPAPTTQPNGNDYFDGDIRVLLPSINVSFTGPVPGNGCPMFNQQGPGGYNGGNDGFGSWSNAPNDLGSNRACLYNLKLGDDGVNGVPYLNHTLHEFGHALGLAHEHERNDVNAGCTESGYGGTASSGFITPYDRNSVMHYKFVSCGINGNYDYTGLSAWDQLALHIMYPEDDLAAEYVGTTVIPVNGTLQLQSAWKARGANMSFAAQNFVWRLNSISLSTTPDLIVTLNTAGTYTLQLTHGDFLGRNYSSTGIVRVLDADTYTSQVLAPQAAMSALLNPFTSSVYLPVVIAP